MTFGRFVNFNVTVGGQVTATEFKTSVTYDGVTFTFDKAMPVGAFVTGEPFVVSSESFSITSVTPAAGDLGGDGNTGNGMMKNPFIGDVDSQGFDQYLAISGISSARTPYDAALNLDPAVSGDVPVVAGEKASFVKSIRNAVRSAGDNGYQMFDRYVVLSVLDASPPLDSYRPGMAGTAKRIRSRADIDFTPRNIALPASWPSVAQIIANVPDNIAPFTFNGEQRRLYRQDASLGTSGDNYSGEIVDDYARFVFAANAAGATDTQRWKIVDRIVTFGNDIEAILDNGDQIGGGAGQGGGVWLWPMALAAVTRDAVLLSVMQSAAMQPNTPFWVDAARTALTPTSNQGDSGQPYLDAQIGAPFIQPEQVSSAHMARYMEIGAFITAWEVLSILSFAQGPAGFSNGAEMLLNGGANDASNPLAARLALLSRHATWTPFFSLSSAYRPGTAWSDAWDEMVATGEFTPWTGQPDQPPLGSSSVLDDTYFSTGAGSVTLNTQGLNYATEPVTRHDLRYSLDAVQWIEVTGIPISGTTFTQTGLLRGAPHWCGWRMASASGTGPWSGNYPEDTPLTSGLDRSKVTTGGTQGAVSPSYAGGVAPAIHQRLSPGWGYPVWEPAPAVLGLNDTELAVGVGYPSAGYPAPTYSFQWRRDGAPISGATAQTYTRTAADAGAVLSCDVTAANANGSVTETTPGVTCPDLTNLPAGTLIDTDFRGAFAIDYAAELATASTDNYEIVHLPTAWPDAWPGLNQGALRYIKDDVRPEGVFTLSRAPATGVQHRIEAQIYKRADDVSDEAPFIIEVLDQAENVLATDQFAFTAEEAEGRASILHDMNEVFTPGGTVTALTVRVRWTRSLGGDNGGGDVYLTRLKVAEAA